MIVAEDQLELYMTSRSDRQVDDAVRTVELVCLILGPQEQSPDIGNMATVTLTNPPAMVLQDAASNLERGDEMLGVHTRMIFSKILVGQPAKGIPGSHSRQEADPDCGVG
jgi:hypothetical protein